MLKLYEKLTRIELDCCGKCPHAHRTGPDPHDHDVRQTIECWHPATIAYFRAGAAGSKVVGIWHTNGYPSEMKPLPSWCPLPDAPPKGACSRFPHADVDDTIAAAVEQPKSQELRAK